MKNISTYLLLITLFISYTANSQDTLRMFGNKKTEKKIETRRQSNQYQSDIKTITGSGQNIGFYIGFKSDFSQIADYDAFSAGGTFAMILNHSLAIGISGKGFFTEPYKKIGGSNTQYNYSGGYGGLLIEPIVFAKFPVHVSFPILIGGGGIANTEWIHYDYKDDEFNVNDSEAFFVAEPGVDLEFNITRWMRLGLSGSYRFTSTFDKTVFDTNPLNGFTGGFSMKFGKF